MLLLGMASRTSVRNGLESETDGIRLVCINIGPKDLVPLVTGAVDGQFVDLLDLL